MAETKPTFQEKIQQELTDAMKSGDSKRVSILRLIISELRNLEIAKRPSKQEVTSEDITKLLRRELNRRNEAAEIYSKAGREDLANQEKYEIEVISEYLPKQLSPQELDTLVDEAVEKNGNNFGQVMRYVIEKAQGRVSGDIVAEVVKQKLSS